MTVAEGIARLARQHALLTSQIPVRYQQAELGQLVRDAMTEEFVAQVRALVAPLYQARLKEEDLCP